MMTDAYGCLAAACVTAVLLGVRPCWRLRLPLVAAATALQLATVALFYRFGGIYAALAVAWPAAYLLFNCRRVILNRLPADYLQHTVSQAADWLVAMQLAAAFVVLVFRNGWLHIPVAALLLAAVQLTVALVVMASVRRQLRKALPPDGLPQVGDHQLPTVTVAVPVRNEGSQLEACLTAILASNYPKLEILAFDDDSHDRTPEIIRSFAHAGVRFLRSDAKPVAGWLDKNHAYAELAANANGEYILFCGADIRLAVRSLRQLVAFAESRHKTMVAVLPQNKLVGRVPLLQAMRYYWEMAPPRRLFRRPPVLSSCWLVARGLLAQAGGFAAVRQSMSPEAHMAYFAASHGDGYSFVRSDGNLGITSEKPVGDQRETALYRRYPQLHRRPEMVALVSFGQASLLLGPAVLSGLALLHQDIPDGTALLAGLAFVIHCLAFGLVQRAAFPAVPAVLAAAAMPASICNDIIYANRSMYRYECGEVLWKNREVSRHVMHSWRPRP